DLHVVGVHLQAAAGRRADVEHPAAVGVGRVVEARAIHGVLLTVDVHVEIGDPAVGVAVGRGERRGVALVAVLLGGRERRGVALVAVLLGGGERRGVALVAVELRRGERRGVALVAVLLGRRERRRVAGVHLRLQAGSVLG